MVRKDTLNAILVKVIFKGLFKIMLQNIFNETKTMVFLFVIFLIQTLFPRIFITLSNRLMFS
jgi:hypothetical protein